MQVEGGDDIELEIAGRQVTVFVQLDKPTTAGLVTRCKSTAQHNAFAGMVAKTRCAARVFGRCNTRVPHAVWALYSTTCSRVITVYIRSALYSRTEGHKLMETRPSMLFQVCKL